MGPRIGTHAQGLLLSVRVQPRAGRDGVAGLAGEALKVRLAAPPVDGKANEALLVFLARALGLRPRQVSLHRGETGRDKVVLIEGLDEASLRERLGRLLDETGT